MATHRPVLARCVSRLGLQLGYLTLCAATPGRPYLRFISHPVTLILPILGAYSFLSPLQPCPFQAGPIQLSLAAAATTHLPQRQEPAGSCPDHLGCVSSELCVCGPSTQSTSQRVPPRSSWTASVKPSHLSTASLPRPRLICHSSVYPFFSTAAPGKKFPTVPEVCGAWTGIWK